MTDKLWFSIDRGGTFTDVFCQEGSGKQHVLKLLSVDGYDRLVEIAGKEMADHEVMIWEAMIEALDAGDLRPTHWYAQKP